MKTTFRILTDKVGGMTFWKQILQSFPPLSLSLFSSLFFFFVFFFLCAALHYLNAWNRLCYRLLCSFLFLEHSLDEPEGEVGGNYATMATRRNITLSERKFRSIGFVAGFTSLSGPICCTLFYVPRLEVFQWVHALPIVKLAIIVFGSLFLTQ